MDQTPIDKHNGAVQRLIEATVTFSQAHTKFLRKITEYLPVHLALVQKIMESERAYDWLKNEVSAHQEAHTSCASQTQVYTTAFEKFSNAILEYIEGFGKNLEAEALQLLAEAQRDLRKASSGGVG